VTVLSIRSSDEAAPSAGFTLHPRGTCTDIALADSGGCTTALNNHDGYSVCKK
jgi:hypothetical protein